MTDIAERLEAFASVWPTAYDSDRQNIALLREAAAEIVRLRREVARLEGVALADELIAVATRSFGGAIAPAEAKDPAPAMPNGVEGLPAAYDIERVLHRVYMDHADYKVTTTLLHDMADAVEAYYRAADNRDAAGVDRSGITPVFRVCTAYESGVGKGMQGRDLDNPYKPDTDEHEAWAHGFAEGRERSGDTPAAVPAGEAVAWLASDGEVFTDKESADRHSKIWGVNPLLTPLYTTPPAPVQAAPQEGEVPQLVRYGRGSAESPYLLDQRDDGYWTPWHVAQRELARALAAHPSACELGAVLEVIDRRKAEAEKRSRADDGYTMGWSDGVAGFARELEAALQHRGDSRGGEGS